MKLKIWPEPTVKALGRCGILLVLLLLSIFFTVELRTAAKAGEIAFRSGISIVLGRFFEAFTRKPTVSGPVPLELKALYGQSLLEQLSIAHRCSDLFKRGSSPSIPSHLGPCSISPTDVDPWGRAYRIHAVPHDSLVVQTTGPSGIDRLNWRNPVLPKLPPGQDAWMVGDNLLVLVELGPKGPSEERAPKRAE